MEGGVEALLAERGHHSPDLLCDHRRGVNHRLGDHRERLRLARHRTTGCGRGQGLGFPGGAGDRYRLCGGVHPRQSVVVYSISLFRLSYPVFVTDDLMVEMTHAHGYDD